jgi:hypothetical protein
MVVVWRATHPPQVLRGQLTLQLLGESLHKHATSHSGTHASSTAPHVNSYALPPVCMHAPTSSVLNAWLCKPVQLVVPEHNVTDMSRRHHGCPVSWRSP